MWGNQLFTTDYSIISDEHESWQPFAPGSAPSTSTPGPSCSGVSSSAAGSSSRRKSWSRAEVLALLESYKERRQECRNSRIRNKDIWEMISNDMEKNAFPDNNGKDCETKFKNIKRAYVNTVDHNNTSGNERKVCAYYDELHDLFHKDVTTNPVALCSNRRGQTRNQPSRDTNCETSESTTDAEDIHQNEEVPRKKKKVQTPRQRETGELVTLFKEFTKSREESEKEKMLKLEQMHNDKMNVMGRFLQVFEKSMDNVDKE